VPTNTELLHDLGPFSNLDRHAVHAGASGAPARHPAAPVFYGDVARGIRVELTLPQRCPGLSPSSLLMLRPDGRWEVFGDEGLLATYDADAVLVSISGTDALDRRDHTPTLVAVQV
jgi:hypothetical protein